MALVTAAWWFENWRGARVWEEAKARAEAAGVSLNRADYAGPEIPDEENLLLNPVFREELEKEGEERLGSWRAPLTDGGISRISDLDPETGETVAFRDYFADGVTEEEALKRVTDLTREEERRIDKIAAEISNAGPRRILARSDACSKLLDLGKEVIKFDSLRAAFSESALTALRSGDAEKALQRIETVDRLRNMLEGPSMVSLIVSMGWLSGELNLVWEGLRLRVWNENQLDRLLGLLESIDLYGAVESSICFEAAFIAEALDDLSNGQDQGSPPITYSNWILLYGPEGRVLREKALAVEGYLRMVEALRRKERAEVLKIRKSFQRANLDEDAISSQGILLLLSIVESVTGPTSVDVRLAKLSLAAERYFAQNGRCPDTVNDFGEGIDVRNVDYQLAPDGRPRIAIAVGDGDEEVSMRWQFSPDDSDSD